jgi:oligopeptide transport system substrate-binding protein
MSNKILSLNKQLEKLISRFPHSFNTSIFKERDRFLAFFDNDFIKKRSSRQLLQLISSFYIKRKELLRNITTSMKNYQNKIRIIPLKIQYPFASKWAVGVLLQIPLKNQYEIFNQHHLLKAIQSILPKLKMIKDSTYIFQDPNEIIKTIYIECEQPHNKSLSLQELNFLKTLLNERVVSRIEKVVPSVFMTRNQEELLRNILTLAREIETHKDLPQIIISLETQTQENFIFSILCVCSKKALANPIEMLTTIKHPFFTWHLERKQLVKYVKQYQPVFAYIMQLFVSPTPAISRNDGSLNFLEVRRQIIQVLKNHIGELRDFNGGILIKQQEALQAIQQFLPDTDGEFVENIFYAISPIEMQAILPLKTLLFLVQTILSTSETPFPNGTNYSINYEKQKTTNLIILCLTNGAFYEMAKEYLTHFDLPEIVLASLYVPRKDFQIICYIIKGDDADGQRAFLQTLKNLLLLWNKKIENQQVLSLFLDRPIFSLDPRIINIGSTSSILLKLLFEGLMRINQQGSLEMAIAQDVKVSQDKKTYTFYLRPSVWSNGTPLTSYDFEYAWKKILSPSFTMPTHFFFNTIKNATVAKNGHLPVSEIGIHCLNNYTLQVELEYPTPYFLEYLTFPMFFPICRQTDINTPNWPNEENHNYICNGAFTLSRNNKTGFVFTKNQLYYDKENIHLDKIVTSSSHYSKMYDFFVKNEIHWLGGAMGVWNDNFKPSENDELITYDDYGIYWCSCNTKHPILKNRKIREALHLSIDKEKFLQTTQYFQKPSYSPLPEVHSQYVTTKNSYNPQKSKLLFQKGLKELRTPLADIKELSLFYCINCPYGKALATFLQTEWKTHLGITILLKGLDFKTLFSNLTATKFHLVLYRWQPWVGDPTYTLGRFVHSKNQGNYSKWTHPQFKKLLKKAFKENNDIIKKELLKAAEKLLIHEVPVIPLFHTSYRAIKKKSLLFKPNHTLLDFKWARFI